MPKENFKASLQVPGILISDHGNVKYTDTNEPKKISEVRGYKFINHRGRKYFVHKLVASVFLSNPENKKVVIHKDGNLQNNKAANLMWTNNYEAQLHAYKVQNKTPSHNVLSEPDIENILKSLKKGVPGTKLAKLYCVSEMTISRIKNGKHRFNSK